MDQTRDCDVLIIGAGMAGSCLARQLKLQQPDLRIIVIEKKQSFDYWVGESTVEAWEDYMTRVLRLGPFLEKNFLQKHGQRYFFDSPAKDLRVSEMSEFGRVGYHSITARQIDRSLFDAKLCEFNRASGVEVLLGTRVLEDADALSLDGRGGHSVSTTAGAIRCRWLVDASGRSSPLARKLDLVPAEPRHQTASYWGRYEGCVPIDELGPDAWRRRVRHTQRYASTNHFMYRGYWIWLIAISDTVVSIGVELDRASTDIHISNGEDLTRFLRGHRALAEILGEKSRQLDFQGLTNLPRCARQHFSKDRWFLTGMSGLFIEVLGSGTSRLYTETNRLIGELILTDRSGDGKRLEAQLLHFNLYVRTSYEASLRDLSDYRRLGSFDLWSNYYGVRLASYWNTRFPNNASDLKSLVELADRHGADCGCTWEKARAAIFERGFSAGVNRLTDEFRSRLDEKGVYYAGNSGRFLDSGFWESRPGIAEKCYDGPDPERERAEEVALYRALASRLAGRMAELEGRTFSESAASSRLADWDAGQTLAELAQLPAAKAQA